MQEHAPEQAHYHRIDQKRYQENQIVDRLETIDGVQRQSHRHPDCELDDDGRENELDRNPQGSCQILLFPRFPVLSQADKVVMGGVEQRVVVETRE